MALVSFIMTVVATINDKLNFFVLQEVVYFIISSFKQWLCMS